MQLCLHIKLNDSDHMPFLANEHRVRMFFAQRCEGYRRELWKRLAPNRREARCSLAVGALIRLERQTTLSRDLMRLLAWHVWQSRRSEEWE